MDRDDDSFKGLDLTKEIIVVDYAPVFVGAYSHIFKGIYRGEAVSCDLSQLDCLTVYQVAIKVLRCSGVTLQAMIRVR